MSTSDLRSSLRSALSFKPTYRNQKTTKNLPAPYLDRISVTEHRGSPKSKHTSNNPNQITSSSWKKLVIRPIGVPNLKHTKINTVFEPESIPFTTPSGKILKGLRTTLQKGYINAVKTANSEIEQQRKQRIQREKYDNRHEEDYYDEEEEEPVDLFDRDKFDETQAYAALDANDSTDSIKSQKEAYSAPPKFEAFLDFVYGPSNLTGTYQRSYNAQMKEYLPVPRK